MSIEVAVLGMGLYMPGYPTLERWLAGERDDSEPAATGEVLDKRSRRRASPITKALADAYGQALAQSELDAATVASVFGSALGEVDTMIGLLDQMWRQTTGLSPMKFATSVHNAAAGVVSIATKNKGFTTSLGADFDTPAMALVEGMGLMATQGQPVIVACGDEAAPSDLVGDQAGWGGLTCAIALTPADDAPADAVRLKGPFMAEPNLPPPDLPRPQALSPDAGLLDLVDSIARGRTGILRLDRGRGRGYCMEILGRP